MAQQAFLAQQRRALEEEGKNNSRPGTPGQDLLTKKLVRRPLARALTSGHLLGGSLIAKLRVHRDRMVTLFDLWDEDGDGMLSRVEFERALRMLAIKPSKAEVNTFFGRFDVDGNGQFELSELLAAMDAHKDHASFKKVGADEDVVVTPLDRVKSGLRVVYKVLASQTAQTILYFSFVIIVQMLTHTLRIEEEFYLDKQFNDMLLFVCEHQPEPLNLSP